MGVTGMLNKLNSFIISFLLVISLSINANATVITGIPQLTIGGRVMTDVTNLIVLMAACGGSAGTTTSGLRRSTDSSAYTPSGSKKFVAVAYSVDVLTAAGSLQLGSADNPIGMETSTAPTNPVYETGTSVFQNINTNQTGHYEGYSGLQIPNGKYGFSIGNAAAAAVIRIFGYEQ